jgi:hypothetical protein
MRLLISTKRIPAQDNFFNPEVSADIRLSIAPPIFVKTKHMTTQQIAAHYYELANQRKFMDIQDTYYAQDVVSQEPEKAASMGMSVITQGLDAIKSKGINRRAMMETLHSYDCGAPIVTADYFSVVLKQEVTFKGKPRISLEEIGVFQVKDGKIIKEQFFY